jgi:excisionase family DNA binding protein
VSDDGQGNGSSVIGSVSRLTYTVDEVAYLLSLSRGITYQYIREGVIPAERVGRRWVISRKRLHAWVDGLPAASGNPLGGG